MGQIPRSTERISYSQLFLKGSLHYSSVTSIKRIPLISLWQAEGNQLHENQHAYEDRQTDRQTQDRQTITSLQIMKYSYRKYASDLAY